MFQQIEVGKVYTGKVVSIPQFGAFMEVLPSKDGLVHVSELAEGPAPKTLKTSSKRRRHHRPVAASLLSNQTGVLTRDSGYCVANPLVQV